MRRNLVLAHKAKSYGMQNSLRIILEARRVKLPVSLALALFEQESGGKNIFGHDPTIYVGAGTVTKAKYLAYKQARGRTRMQGVGPGQITWWATQDQADAMGGCWKPKYNIRIALETLASNIRAHGYVDGIMAYNGSGPAAVAYSASVRSLAARWHRRLT